MNQLPGVLAKPGPGVGEDATPGWRMPALQGREREPNEPNVIGLFSSFILHPFEEGANHETTQQSTAAYAGSVNARVWHRLPDRSHRPCALPARRTEHRRPLRALGSPRPPRGAG